MDNRETTVETIKANMANNHDLVVTMLEQITHNQHELNVKVSQVTREHNTLMGEIATIKNGYQPYQITQMLHWVENKKRSEEESHYHVKKSFINWLVPLLSIAVVIGMIVVFSTLGVSVK